MKKSLLLLFALTLFQTIHSQVCVTNLTTQAELDQFFIDNPTCTTIDGDVYIGSDIDQITDASGLQNITNITGTLYISRASVMDLSGLSNIASVGTLEMNGTWSAAEMNDVANIQTISNLFLDAYFMEDLHVFDDITTLESLKIGFDPITFLSPRPSFYNVFPNLISVNQYLTLAEIYGECDSLTGFNALQSVGALNLSFYDEFWIEHLDAFHNLQMIEGTFYCSDLHAGSISGFENLESIHEIYAFSIMCQGAMPDFNALTNLDYMTLFVESPHLPEFPALTIITNDLFLYAFCPDFEMPNLQTVGGDCSIYSSVDAWATGPSVLNFSSLTNVGGNFSFGDPYQDNLHVFSNLEYVGGVFELAYNASMTSCDIDYFCDNLPISPASFDIHENGPGCNTGEEILATCGNNVADGMVFYDLDCDGVFNNADSPVVNPIITNEFNVPVSNSNAAGHFFVPLSDNTTSTLSISNMPGFSTTPQTFTTTGTATTFNNANFAMCPQADLHNVSVSQLWASPFVPGFGNYQYFVITNHGAQSEEVSLSYEMTNMPGVTALTITDGGVLNGNVITWNSLIVPALGQTYVAFYLSLDSATPIGQILVSNLSADFTSASIVDIYPADNSLALTTTVVGSYDPNDITVNIPAYNHELLANGEALSLDYTIRFQNTGTAEAINVRVLDEIEEDLDLTSFEMTGSSHPCTLTFNENNQVEWLYENIMLPDSTSNEEESHGYIQYRIKTQPNLLLDDVIENTAAIYFDFNEPVITNTATTVFYVCPATQEPLADQTICEGEVVAFSGPTGWQDYSWTTFEGESSTTNQLQMMNLEVGSYEILFDASTEFCHYHDDVMVTVLSVPSTPTITQNGNILTATGSGLFQWTLNGVQLIDGDNSIEITESGVYGVSVTSNSCTSSVTASDFTAIGVLENQFENEFSLMPNPMTHSTVLKVSAENFANTEVKISNALGQVMRLQKLTSNTVVITNENLPDGVYFVSQIRQNQTSNNTLKLVVSH